MKAMGSDKSPNTSTRIYSVVDDDPRPRAKVISYAQRLLRGASMEDDNLSSFRQRVFGSGELQLYCQKLTTHRLFKIKSFEKHMRTSTVPSKQLNPYRISLRSPVRWKARCFDMFSYSAALGM